MRYDKHSNPLNFEWIDLFNHVLEYGEDAAPRGKKVKEILNVQIAVNMNYPLLTIPERKLNFRFAAAEAAWMISGRTDVEYLAKYNPRMREFSDDGITLAGAYGPRIMTQYHYVLSKLWEDRDTRQATLTIWKPSPAPSKDIPCTVAMDFKIRNDALHTSVFMRSSDIWLGVPYDVFSFSMVSAYVAALYNSGPAGSITKPAPIGLGKLYLTAASSHLYEENWKALGDKPWDVDPEPSLARPAPPWITFPETPRSLIHNLEKLAETRKGDGSYLRWWENV